MDQKISVNFIGRRPLDWSPAVASTGDIAVTDDAAATSPPSQSSTADPRFIAFVQAQLDRINDSEGSTTKERTERADKITQLFAIRDLLTDPSAHTTGLASWPDLTGDRLHIFMGVYLDGLTNGISKLLKEWNTAKITTSVKRDAADRSAQKNVPKWYGSRCVLTGTAKPQGAHIVPVRAKDADHAETWKLLATFWPSWLDPEIETNIELIYGREQENVLPLTHTMHAFWDLFYFALRPVAHPQDPAHRLYLQLVWLRDPDGGRIDNNEHGWNHARFGGGCDFRRARDEHQPAAFFPALQHGAVYEFVTTDAVTCPLPSIHLLRIQCGVHRIMAGIQAAGALKTIFSEDPPSDDDGETAGYQDLDATDVPPEWRSMLDAAIDTGVLDEQAAVRWGRAFARAADDERAEAERSQRWMRTWGRVIHEDEDEDEDDNDNEEDGDEDP